MIFTAGIFPFYILAALLSDSAAILTDLLATAFDLTALSSCWLVLRLAQNAQAAKYAYGLGKLENLAEMLIAILQSILVIIAGSQAIARILAPEPVSGAAVGIAVTVAAVAGNAYFSRRARRLARETRSPVLVAQARVHLISAVGSAAVLAVICIVSAFPSVTWLYYLDPIASFFVIAFMLFNIYAMLSNSVSSLLDQAIDEAGQMRILKVLASHFHDFDELGDIRTRQLGGRMAVELHLGFDRDWSVVEARQAVARIVTAVKAAFAEAGDDVDVAVVLMPS